MDEIAIEKFTVRQGVEEDLGDVVVLWLKMVRELMPKGNPDVSLWWRMARQSIRSGLYYLFVGESDGQIVGFGDFFLFPEPSTSQIHWVGQHLYVKPEYRNTDLAGKIYRMGIKAGKRMGATIFELFCFYEAQEFWRKKGYRPLRALLRKEIKHV